MCGTHLREIRKARAEREACTEPDERPSLLEFFARDCPSGLVAPHWLTPYAEALERAIHGDLRICVHAPPQHGKTELTLRAFLYWARYFPGFRHAYVTYNDTRSKEVAKDFRRIALEAGFDVGGTLDVSELGSTRIKFTSIDGGLTGFAVTGVCVIDDPIKDAKEARSAARRKACIEFWKSSARSRRHAGTSFIVMATRWHVADLTGYLLDKESTHWEYVCLAAIAEPVNDNDLDDEGRLRSDPNHRRPGEALWPERKPPEFFVEERADSYWWTAMYQGRPRPEGGAVFGEAHYYSSLPDRGYRVCYGIDLAVTAKTSANCSVSLEGWAVDDGKDEFGKRQVKLYIVDAQVKQVEAPSFTLTLKAQQSRRPGTMRFYGSGTEKGMVQFVRQKIPKLQIKAASTDKFQRATRGGTGASFGWNSGRILLPLDEEALAPTARDGAVDFSWVERVLDEVQAFTGQSDPADDVVDALAALWDEASAKKLDLSKWVV